MGAGEITGVDVQVFIVAVMAVRVPSHVPLLIAA